MACLFVSDLHGRTELYRKLFRTIRDEAPEVVFFGGDLLPSGLMFNLMTDSGLASFTEDFLRPELSTLRTQMGADYPQMIVILGNDDGKSEESFFEEITTEGLCTYAQDRWIMAGKYDVCGYAYTPPSPFRLKDWEKYDVSRFVDPGCVSPEDGMHSIAVSKQELRYSTIQKDLDKLSSGRNLDNTIFLFHSPPYNTNLDRAALDGKMIDFVPFDTHIGSIAIERFIRNRQPLLTLHGHVHESTRLTGQWSDKIGQSHCFNAAHDGEELSIISFEPEELHKAKRRLI